MYTNSDRRKYIHVLRVQPALSNTLNIKNTIAKIGKMSLTKTSYVIHRIVIVFIALAPPFEYLSSLIFFHAVISQLLKLYITTTEPFITSPSEVQICDLRYIHFQCNVYPKRRQIFTESVIKMEGFKSDKSKEISNRTCQLNDLLFRFYFIKRLTTVKANDGVWHHICLSWEKILGSWKFFKDGLVKQEGTSFKIGYTIRQGGTLVLGQEQDSIGGEFETSQSFQGMLSDVNVWDRALLVTQIKEMSQSCLPDEGNVYKWTNFLRQGGPKLVEPSPCEPFTSLGW